MRAKQIADLLRDNLNAGFGAAELTPSATAVSEYAPIREDRQLQTLTVICFPFAKDLELESRGSDRKSYTIGVFVAMARGSGQSDEQLAAHVAPLVDAIGERVLRTILDGATCRSVEHDPLYDHERLRTHGIFEAVIACEFTESTAA